jgi:hypothetical protein
VVQKTATATPHTRRQVHRVASLNVTNPEHGRGGDALQWALRYAALGLRVIPIKPGHKSPAPLAWVEAATTDPDVITAWWTGLYANHGIGLVLGQVRPDRWLFAVDIDQHGADGAAIWAELSRGHDVPVTVTALTGGGGTHHVYWSPFEIRNSRLADGIDIRGAGGQILVEPTIHPNGNPYSWEDGPFEYKFARAPDWLLELLTRPEPEPTPRSSAPTDGDRPGDLWAAQTTWAQLLEADGWTLSHSRDGEDYWVRPGKTKREGISATVGYKGADVLKVFTSSVPFLQPEETYNKFRYLAATRYDGDYAATARALAQQGYHAPDIDWNQLAGHDVAETIEAATEAAAEMADTPASKVDWATVFDRDMGGDWLLEPLIARGRGHALYAGQKAGKSLLIASVLVPAAMGLPVLDRPAGEPLRTLYLDYEMTHEDIAERVESMGYGAEHAAELEPLEYHIIPAIPPLDTPEGGRMVLEWALRHRAQLVVIDTLARGVAGGENDADTYRAYYRCTGSVLKAAGIATMRLDHSGKDADRGQRGSSAKADDVDVVWKLTARQGGAFTLKATHKRMNWIPEKRDFQRCDDPLRYVQISGSWPAGTRECADALDELGVPLDATVRAAGRMLRDADKGAGTDVVTAAVKYRRDAQERAQEHFIHRHRNADQERAATTPLTSQEHAQERSGTTSESLRNTGSLRSRTPVPQTPDNADF